MGWKNATGWWLLIVFLLCLFGILVAAFPAQSAIASLVVIATLGLLLAKARSFVGLLALFASMATALAIGFAAVRRDTSYLFPALLFALVGGILYAKRNDKNMDLFAPFVITCAGFGLLFGWVGLEHLWRADLSPDLVRRSIWYVSMGFVFFVVGYAVPLPAFGADKLWLRGDNWSPGRTTSAIAVCSFLGLVSFDLTMRLAGFRSVLQVYRDVLAFRFSTYGEITALAIVTQTLLSMSCILLLIKILRGGRLGFLGLVVFLAYLLFVFALFGAYGTRGPILNLLGGLLMCYHYLKRRIKPREIAIVAVLGGLFTASYALYRGAGTGWRSAAEAQQAFKELKFYDAVFYRLDAMSVFAVVIDHPPRNDPKSFIMGTLLRSAPRTWAPTKPFASGPEITREYWPGVFAKQTTFEASVFGELYYYLGVQGIILGMIVFGICIKFLQKYYEGKTTRADFLFHYSLIFWFPIGVLLTGFNSLGTHSVLVLTACAWIVLAYLNARKAGRTATDHVSSSPRLGLSAAHKAPLPKQVR